MPGCSARAEPWLPLAQALDAAEEEERSAEASFELLGAEDVPAPPDIGDNLTVKPAEMTVAALQEALSKRGLDTKWNPLSANKKKDLVDRLQVGPLRTGRCAAMSRSDSLPFLYQAGSSVVLCATMVRPWQHNALPHRGHGGHEAYAQERLAVRCRTT